MRKRKINYFKLIRSLIVLFVILYLIILGIIKLSTNNNYQEQEVKFSTYHVSKGETLWSIAKNQNSEKDIREVVYMIRKDNGNMNANVSIGQEIILRDNY